MIVVKIEGIPADDESAENIEAILNDAYYLDPFRTITVTVVEVES